MVNKLNASSTNTLDGSLDSYIDDTMFKKWYTLLQCPGSWETPSDRVLLLGSGTKLWMCSQMITIRLVYSQDDEVKAWSNPSRVERERALPLTWSRCWGPKNWAERAEDRLHPLNQQRGEICNTYSKYKSNTAIVIGVVKSDRCRCMELN